MPFPRIRYCPLCKCVPIPPYRAMCAICFERVPWKMRADLMNTYRARVIKPEAYYEKLIEVRQWLDNAKPIQLEEGLGRYGRTE